MTHNDYSMCRLCEARNRYDIITCCYEASCRSWNKILFDVYFYYNLDL